MGGKQSKNKKNRGNDAIRRDRWSHVYSITPPDSDDPMNDPTYHLQGEPITYINEDTIETLDTVEDIWVLREGTDATCKTFDDGEFKHDSGQIVYRETVLHGEEPESLPTDHYDMINESEIESETELKQLGTSETNLKQPLTNQTNNAQSRQYQQLPFQSRPTKTNQPRHDYEHMVKIFQPLLVANVIVKRLLPHLPFLSNPERIRAIEERDPRAAVIYLIDELCSSCDSEPGRWKQFIQALEHCGYTHIVRTLRGQDPVDHTYQREYLKIITPILRELIYPSELLPVLWAVDVISNEDKEEIGQLERNLGSLAAVDRLLDLIPRRHTHWYSHFVDALRTVGRTEAVDILAIPEILDINDGSSDKETSRENKKPSTSHVEASDDLFYLEYIEAEVPKKMKPHTEMDIVPDSCAYLDCENYETYKEMDELYLSMRDNKSPELRVNAQKNALKEIETKSLYEYELYDDVSYTAADTSQSNRSSQDNEKISKECEPPQEDALKESACVGRGSSRVTDFKIGYETNNRTDVYRYEPPIPTSTAPEAPEHTDGADENSSQDSLDTNDVIADDIPETNDVEVIALSAPARKRCRYQDFTDYPAKKGNIKPPIPSPRKPKEAALSTPPRTCRYYEYTHLHDHQDNAKVIKPPKPSPRKHTLQYKRLLARKENGVDKFNTMTNPGEFVQEPETCRIFKEQDKKDQNYCVEKRELSKNLPDISESSEEETKPVIKTIVDRKRLSRGKVKASVLKRKNKWKRFQHTALNSRRKPLNNFPSGLQDVKCFNFKRGKALISRDRLPTPRKRNAELDERSKSKSLPSDITRSCNDQNKTIDHKNAPGTDNKNASIVQRPYYSEPFRCHRTKEDEDIFTTIQQMCSDRHIGKSRRSAGGAFGLHSQSHAQCRSYHRSISDTSELLDILESCKISSGIDYTLKSNTEIRVVTTDNLHPELRSDLEKVRDLEVKLNNLIHGEKVLRKRLQLQEDVNEILKQKRHLSSKLSVKEKEAKALEAAIAGEMSNSAEDFIPYNTGELCIREDLPRTELQQPVAVTNSVLNNNGTVAADTLSASSNKLTDAEVVKRKNETIDKDSAFYSEYTTKL